MTISAFGLPAMAQTTDEIEALRAEIRQLRAEVETLKSEKSDPAIAELERRIDILTRAIESIDTGRSRASADQYQAGLGQAASKVYRSDLGLSFGGYGEMVYENRESSNDQIDFLRAILYTGYKFSDRVVFNSEIEFEHATSGDGIGEVSVEFAYLDFMLRPEASIRAGMLLVPMGLVNELHEPTAFLGVMRPTVERSVIPSTWRENGLGLYGESGSLSYRAYLINGFRGEEFGSGGLRGGRQSGGKAIANDFAFVGRLDWAPAEGLLFGGSVYSGDSGQDLPIDVSTTILELHGMASLRGWSFRALWADASVDDVAELNGLLGLTGAASVGEDLGGWYAEVGYDLTTMMRFGESSITPFVRYEQVDTQKSVPSGFSRNPANDQEILTIGVSWKPIPQTIFKADYQLIEIGTGDENRQFNLGLGYIF